MSRLVVVLIVVALGAGMALPSVSAGPRRRRREEVREEGQEEVQEVKTLDVYVATNVVMKNGNNRSGCAEGHTYEKPQKLQRK